MKKNTFALILSVAIALFSSCGSDDAKSDSVQTQVEDTRHGYSANDLPITQDDVNRAKELTKMVPSLAPHPKPSPTTKEDVKRMEELGSTFDRGIKSSKPPKYVPIVNTSMYKWMKKNHVSVYSVKQALQSQQAVPVTTGYYGVVEVNALEEIRSSVLPKNDTFVSNSGWQMLSTTKGIHIVDSLRYGWDAIVGSSVNTDDLKPGVYTYNFVSVSIPHEDFPPYRDTVQRSVVIVRKGCKMYW